MQILRFNAQTVRLTELDPMLYQLLLEIVPSADPAGSDAARRRLFSAPTSDEGEAEFAQDWESYVVPDLRGLFQSALETIHSDLATNRPRPGRAPAAVDIPVPHLDGWIHGLNQARLALAARHDFSEAEMDRDLTVAANPRAYALLQIRFYGVLEELLLREVESDSGAAGER